MKISYLTMIEADEGKVLVKDGNYCSSVLLRKGETEEGWSEITQEEYNEIIAQKEIEEQNLEEENENN